MATDAVGRARHWRAVHRKGMNGVHAGRVRTRRLGGGGVRDS